MLGTSLSIHGISISARQRVWKVRASSIGSFLNRMPALENAPDDVIQGSGLAGMTGCELHPRSRMLRSRSVVRLVLARRYPDCFVVQQRKVSASCLGRSLMCNILRTVMEMESNQLYECGIGDGVDSGLMVARHYWF